MFDSVIFSKATLDHLLTSVPKQNSGCRKLKAGCQHISRVLYLFWRHGFYELKRALCSGVLCIGGLIYLHRQFLNNVMGNDTMASKLKQLQSKATLASEFLSKHGSTYYKQLLEENKQHIQHPATVEKCNELSKQLFYTRLASLPARNEAFWKEVGQVKQMWAKKQDLKVEQLGVAALFGLECFAWFCAGEIVGRGFTFTGYYV